MPVHYRSRTVKRETLQTVSLLVPHLAPGASVLDIGCGEGYVLDELAGRGVTNVHGVDISAQIRVDGAAGCGDLSVGALHTPRPLNPSRAEPDVRGLSIETHWA